jgi:hypothetical protein
VPGIGDVYTVRTDKWVKKSGDTMLDAATITAGRDPTANLEVATKQYVDNAVATGGFDYRSTPIAGAHYYYGSWGSALTATSLVAANIGDCYVTPMRVSTSLTWTKIRGRVGNASASTHRVGIYYLSETTWLPTSIATDAGTFTWPGAGSDHDFTISFTATSRLIGLAWLYESRTDAVNPSVTFLQVPAQNWPPGWDPDAAGANLQTAVPFRIISTGNAAGALPAVGTFSLSSTSATATNTQTGLAMRRA